MYAFGQFCFAVGCLTAVGFFVRWRLRVNKARRADRTGGGDDGSGPVDRPRDGGVNDSMK